MACDHAVVVPVGVESFADRAGGRGGKVDGGQRNVPAVQVGDPQSHQGDGDDDIHDPRGSAFKEVLHPHHSQSKGEFGLHGHITSTFLLSGPEILILYTSFWTGQG